MRLSQKQKCPICRFWICSRQSLLFDRVPIYHAPAQCKGAVEAFETRSEGRFPGSVSVSSDGEEAGAALVCWDLTRE